MGVGHPDDRPSMIEWLRERWRSGECCGRRGADGDRCGYCGQRIHGEPALWRWAGIACLLVMSGGLGWLLGDAALALYNRIAEPNDQPPVTTTTIPPVAADPLSIGTPECLDIAMWATREQPGVGPSPYRVNKVAEVYPPEARPGERVCRTSFVDNTSNYFHPVLRGYVCSNSDFWAARASPIACLVALRDEP